MVYNIPLASAIYQHESAVGNVCPLSPEPLSHLPPDPTPLGFHRAPDLSSLHDTANSTDYLILHMVKVKVAQLCPILCDNMDCAVHGILQARILEWVACPFSSGSSQPRN